MKDDSPIPLDGPESASAKMSREEPMKAPDFSAGKLDQKTLVNLIVESTSELVAVTTFSLPPRYVYLSPSHKKILGYDPGDLLNKSALDLIHPDDITMLFPLLEKYLALQSGDKNPPDELKLPTERILYRLIDKSGNWHYLETTGDLLADDCILFISRDVTDRVKAEQAVLKAKELLEAQVQERTEALAQANETLRQEVNERREKEEALRDSESRYRTILESIEDGYFEVDLAGNLTFFNNALCRITGYSAQELYGMNNRAYTEPDTAERMYEIFNRIYRTGQPSKINDYEVIKKDGTKSTMALSTSLIRDAHGNAMGFRGIVRDVTEHERLQNRLRESEEKYSNIIQTMEEGYYELDTKGTFLFFNESLSRILGYASEEMMGMNNRQYMSQETAKEVYRVCTEVYQTGVPAKAFDWEVIRKDGEKRHMETSISVLRDSHGKPIGFRGVSRDVTQRWLAQKALEESEEKYRTILQSIEDGYFEVDLAGNLTFFNNALCRILGYSPEELQGINNRSYMTEETASTVYQTFNQVYMTGKPTKVLGWELVRKDGHKRYVETSVSPISDQKGDCVGFRGIARDITEQKALEKAKERIINHLSHELGTPLYIIDSALVRISSAIQEADFSKMKDWVARAQRNLDRLRDLREKIDDILNERPIQQRENIHYFVEAALGLLEELEEDPLKERAEAIRQSIVRRLESLHRMDEVEIESIHVDNFLREVCTEAKESMKERQIEIVEVFEKGLSIEMNKRVLKKVCEGFLRNAIENTPDEGKIEIKLTSDDHLARIDFLDFGIGITAENQKLIFGGFFHTQDTYRYASRRPYFFSAGGSGADLLRAKVLSRRFNFSIDFSSNRCVHLRSDTDECPGRISLCPFIKGKEECLSSGGSTFSLLLPLS